MLQPFATNNTTLVSESENEKLCKIEGTIRSENSGVGIQKAKGIEMQSNNPIIPSP